MILTKETIRSYNETRASANTNIVCHAPSVNLNFEQNGNVRACCYNTQHILGQWPQQTIKEIWESKSAGELRQYVKENNLGGGCIECGKMIEAANYQGVRAKYYDEFASGAITSGIDRLKSMVTGHVAYPKVMEFELSNQCNLECVMCNGYFSSSIRKNREHLPPIVSPYNDQFVAELAEFIPHLTDAKFLGGEPFMIDIYLTIWELIRKLNPNIRIHITTNGTFLNNRIKDLLEGLRAGIILSIDSVNRETYPKIRVNGSFDKVMENLEYFRDYTNRKKTFLSIAACPITHNWKELPQLLAFCLDKKIALYFNAVFSPSELSLKDQPPEHLNEVITYLSSYQTPAIKGNPQSTDNLSIKAYHDFINQLRGWQEEAMARETRAYVHIQQSHNEDLTEYLKSGLPIEWSVEKVKDAIRRQSEVAAFGYDDKDKDLRLYIAKLFASTPTGKISELLSCYPAVYDEQNNSHAAAGTANKILALSVSIDQHPQRKEILARISQASASVFTGVLIERDLSELQGDIQKLFTA